MHTHTGRPRARNRTQPRIHHSDWWWWMAGWLRHHHHHRRRGGWGECFGRSVVFPDRSSVKSLPAAASAAGGGGRCRLALTRTEPKSVFSAVFTFHPSSSANAWDDVCVTARFPLPLSVHARRRWRRRRRRSRAPSISPTPGEGIVLGAPRCKNS